MTDLVKLMSTLVDSNGKILVEGIMDSVQPVTKEEETLYETIEFDVAKFRDELGVHTLQNDKMSLLMARWRYPTLSLHGIEGAFSGKGAKTVIPAKVTGKFSMRLVPDQDPKEIEKLVIAHVKKEFAKVRCCRFFIYDAHAVLERLSGLTLCRCTHQTRWKSRWCMELRRGFLTPNIPTTTLPQRRSRKCMAFHQIIPGRVGLSQSHRLWKTLRA
jgi:hypothetical protein